MDPVEVHPGGVLVTGAAAGPALAAGAQPVPDGGGHRRWQQREPFLRQGGEGRDPVVVQEPGEAEDLGGAGDAEVRRCRAAGSWDQAIMSAGWWPASTTASARLVSVMIRSFHPRAAASPAAMCLACSRAGPVIAEAAQCRLSKSSDSPGPLSCSWVQPGAAAGQAALAGGACGAGPVLPRRLMPARDSCQYPVPVKSSGVSQRRPAAAMPACSQHSRQWPFLTAMTRWQPAHWPRW